ncbi:MAG: hypothetical protein LKG56_04310 [Lachnospiraceae bacterium]|jgi:uncharacterized membrane protein YczE|nr:hypothetical protein [Lachnospiraceae bacterium]MCH4032315.1 hypothetical protein [Lachnospiraceae bacterium]MCH4108807.1 hypothetical protein [Lachnospiraceae bacterium]MCI1302338.1 hypothetical protein [Lachnospiraceae bacterium]MCI1331503.1 hypothetical protein [Lachnospiraceae bacterium]
MKINIFHKKHLAARTLVVILSVVLMGFALSWLFWIDMGADPYTVMNRAVSARLGMSIGNWQLILNTVLFVLVLLFGSSNIGIGTLVNMTLVGYTLDFFTGLWNRTVPKEATTQGAARLLILALALLIFVLSAAVYMDVHLGAAPYDAVPFILSEHLPKVPFRLVRMVCDFTCIAIGCLLGAKLQAVPVLMALLLGPAVALVARYGAKYFPTLLGEDD